MVEADYEKIQVLYETDMISNITDQIIPDIKEQEEKPFDDVYSIVSINEAFHITIKQIGIAHMIRNSVKFVSYKDLRVFVMF